MTRVIWNGEGQLPDGAVYFTNHNGTIMGRPYVRLRVQRALSKFSKLYTPEQRQKALAATVDNDGWLVPRNGSLVAAVCREAVSYLLTEVE